MLCGSRIDFSYGGIKPCAETNGFRLSHTAHGSFEYKVDVRSPGIYTFAIDIDKCLNKFNVSLYGREENEDPASDGKLIGQWAGDSSSGGSGLGPGALFEVDAELGSRIKWLVLVLGRGSSDIDRFRVTGFRPNVSKPEVTPEVSVQEEIAADSRPIILFPIAGTIALVAVLFVFESKRRSRLRQKNLKETAGPGKNSEW